MDDEFKIYVEQLRGGRERKINESLPSNFLDIQEEDLAFEKNVNLSGVAYVVENELILHWDVEGEALVACSICNEKVPVEFHIRDFYHSEPLSSIKSGIYNFKDLLRDTILLEIPPFAECNEGQCPKRKEIKKYLKSSSEEELGQDEGYHPFADLDLKE